MFDVITIGTATRDVFLQSPLFKVLKDPKHLARIGFKSGEAQCFALGAKIEIEKPEFLIGGGAANAAVAFARQGFHAGALIKTGPDFVGGEILKKLRREGVRPLALQSDRKKGTAWSAILLSPGGERTILNYRGASEDLAVKEVPFRTLRARWFYIAPGRIPFSVISRIVGAAKRAGARIAMDPSKHYLKMGPKKLRPLFRHLDLIKMNREEASYLTGVPYGDERRIFRKFDELVKGLAVMTDGERGVSVSDGKRIYRAGVFKEKKLADRTGAGDAFGSAFVAGLIRKGGKTFGAEAIRYAIRLGAANATSVVEHIGAQEGILRRRDFERQKRWKKLFIKERAL